MPPRRNKQESKSATISSGSLPFDLVSQECTRTRRELNAFSLNVPTRHAGTLTTVTYPNSSLNEGVQDAERKAGNCGHKSGQQYCEQPF
jgi:hypothetical protein